MDSRRIYGGKERRTALFSSGMDIAWYGRSTAHLYNTKAAWWCDVGLVLGSIHSPFSPSSFSASYPAQSALLQVPQSQGNTMPCRRIPRPGVELILRGSFSQPPQAPQTSARPISTQRDCLSVAALTYHGLSHLSGFSLYMRQVRELMSFLSVTGWAERRHAGKNR